jgi:hypothetical protein
VLDLLHHTFWKEAYEELEEWTMEILSKEI